MYVSALEQYAVWIGELFFPIVLSILDIHSIVVIIIIRMNLSIPQ